MSERMNLRALAMTFCENWGPSAEFQAQSGRFVDDLRELLEGYGRLALERQNLPEMPAWELHMSATLREREEGEA